MLADQASCAAFASGEKDSVAPPGASGKVFDLSHAILCPELLSDVPDLFSLFRVPVQDHPGEHGRRSEKLLWNFETGYARSPRTTTLPPQDGCEDTNARLRQWRPGKKKRRETFSLYESLDEPRQ